MFATGERSKHLGRVQIVTGGDDYGIYIRVVKDLCVIGRTIMEPEFPCRMAAASTRGRADSNQFGSVRVLDGG